MAETRRPDEPDGAPAPLVAAQGDNPVDFDPDEALASVRGSSVEAAPTAESLPFYKPDDAAEPAAGGALETLENAADTERPSAVHEEPLEVPSLVEEAEVAELSETPAPGAAMEASPDSGAESATLSEDESAALHPGFETAEDPRIPNTKQYFKIGEVAKITGLKPYVLRYWESQFPSVRPTKTRAGQRMYRRQDVAALLKVKRLRYSEHHTIAAAKKVITQSRRPGKKRVAASVADRARNDLAKTTTPPSAAQLGLGFPTAPKTAELARRLAEMRRAVLDLLDAAKE